LFSIEIRPRQRVSFFFPYASVFAVHDRIDELLEQSAAELRRPACSQGDRTCSFDSSTSSMNASLLTSVVVIDAIEQRDQFAEMTQALEVFLARSADEAAGLEQHFLEGPVAARRRALCSPCGCTISSDENCA
jgi:hypothetical protein